MQEALSTSQIKRQPLLSRLLLLFILAMILANLGGSMYGPLLPLYVEDLGASVNQIGLFFTLSSVIPLALQILGGWLSDSIGRLRAIALGSIAGMLGYLALILAPSWQWLLLATAFLAITGSLVAPSFDAFIAEQSSEENRAKTFGITQTLFGIVGVIGPALGGWLAQEHGFKRMLLAAAILYLLATIIRVGMACQASRNGSTEKGRLSWGGLKANLTTMFGLLMAGGIVTWILITDGIRDVAFALSMNLFPVYMQQQLELTLSQIGVGNSIFGLCTMLTHLPGGWLADKIGERLGIALGFILTALALGLLVFAPAGSWQLVYLGWGIAGIGVGLMTPAYLSLISKAVPTQVRGTAFGLFSTSLGLISLPAPWIGAQLWEHVDPRLPFLVTAIALSLSVIPVWLKFNLNSGQMLPMKE